MRATLVEEVPQFGANPRGVEMPVVGGDVTVQALSDIKSTLTMQVPAEYWDLVQPFGAEIYIERGIEFAPGDAEYVGLGYHRIEQATQDDAPYGPIKIHALDRISQLQQNKLAFPLPLNDGNTHRAVFERLVNGIAIPQQAQYPGLAPDGYGMYLDARVPIYWRSYDPDTTLIIGDQIVEDDAYAYLAQLIKFYYAGLRFRVTGELEVFSFKFDFSTPVDTLRGGAGGQIISTKRTVTRTGVHNIVTAYGTDPSSITDFIITFNSDSASPLAYNKRTFPRFGPSPTYYSSPLLQTNGDVETAAGVLLRRYIALPLEHTLRVVCNPALEPNDPIDVVVRPEFPAFRCFVDTITIPLTANTAGTITTRIPTATEGLSLGLGILAR
ncbi:MAG: DUF5047 domain-containing protein [Pseudonocardiaceae bacterium]